MALFVNPYTFVPHVVSPERRPPVGHAAMEADRFSGILEVTLTARTPLLIGGFPAGGSPAESDVQDLPRRKDGTVMIPGSGLMGAVRSLHEALAGGCLRIVDTNWVPVHRHPATTAETADLRMAVVREVDDKGQAKSVALCDDWMRIPKELLPGIANGDDDLPQTGDQLSYRSSKRLQGNALRPRSEDHPDWTAPGEITRIRRMSPLTDDCWVLLVTGTNARPVPKATDHNKPAKRSPVHYAAGRIGPDAPVCPIPEDTWENYTKTVEGADDLRRASLTKAGAPDGQESAWGTRPPEYADVWWPPQEESNGASRTGNNRLWVTSSMPSVRIGTPARLQGHRNGIWMVSQVPSFSPIGRLARLQGHRNPFSLIRGNRGLTAHPHRPARARRIPGPARQPRTPRRSWSRTPLG